MKYYIFLGFFAVAAAFPGIIHQEAPQISEKYDHQALIGESGHHHQVEHEHAKSHQSIKFEHFHPVPVYVKKEHSHLLKHPLEKGKSEQNLKQIHPETQHSHGGGLVLEDHRYDSEQHIGSLGHGGYEHEALGHAGLEQGSFEHGGLHQGSFEHGDLQQGSLEHGIQQQSLDHSGLQQGGYEQGGYEQYSGSFEGGEGLKAYAEPNNYYALQAQGHGGHGSSEGY